MNQEEEEREEAKTYRVVFDPPLGEETKEGEGRLMKFVRLEREFGEEFHPEGIYISEEGIKKLLKMCSEEK